MINRKLILSVVVLTMLAVGFPTVLANSSNDLLRMDVRKSSAQDTVDVTFYTTGNPANSVVSRKSGNTYVVLLPNVSGNQSVVPSLGGVKDLISDITVKNIDDSIGGYTKITFNTTKPVRIQTFSKQTAPLTSAQQGYKNLIAQSNNIKPISTTSAKQPAAQTKTPAATAQTKPASQAAKTTTPVSNTQKQVQNKSAAQKTAAVSPKAAVNTAKPAPKAEAKAQNNVKSVKSEPAKSVETAKPKASASTDSQPKVVKEQVKPVEESKPAEKAQPKDNTEVVDEGIMPVVDNIAQEAPQSDVVSDENYAQSGKSPKSHNSSHNISIVLIAGAFCIFGIFLFAGLANIISRGVEDKRNRLKEYMEEKTAEESESGSSELQEIIEDKGSNWQDKYKRYSQIKEEKKKRANKGRMSYVTDSATSKGVIVSDAQLAKNNMQETISRMEHSLAQTPSNGQYIDFSNKYHSEDDSISNKMAQVKLKSFAKSVNLSETGRNLVSFEDIANRKKTLKEGKFVRMTNSNLSMSKRKSASTGLNFANIVRNNENFAHNKSENIVMNKQQEEYVLSSINEYLDLLDSEQKAPVEMIENSKEISKALESASAQLANAKSLVTNPMVSQRKSMFSKDHGISINGLNIKSNYVIDSNRSIYMVDLDGVSAIIGKIGDEIFVLKKFDKVVNKPMQVRLDYGNTYIVKAGTFKCLVDVTDQKMGTLLEI